MTPQRYDRQGVAVDPSTNESTQPPTELLGGLVLLAEIAGGTRDHQVFGTIRAAPRKRHDVIDVVVAPSPLVAPVTAAVLTRALGSPLAGDDARALSPAHAATTPSGVYIHSIIYSRLTRARGGACGA